jgi:hypothetical protein
VKKAARYLVIVILAIWLVKDPAGAASLTRHAMAGLSHAAQSLSDFATGLG